VYRKQHSGSLGLQCSDWSCPNPHSDLILVRSVFSEGHREVIMEVSKVPSVSVSLFDDDLMNCPGVLITKYLLDVRLIHSSKLPYFMQL
jgi:hypothetical protein